MGDKPNAPERHEFSERLGRRVALLVVSLFSGRRAIGGSDIHLPSKRWPCLSARALPAHGMRRAILPLARLYQLRLRQPMTIPHQNPHRPVRNIPVRKILVVGQIYRYTFDVAVAMPMRAVVIDGDVEGFTHEQLAAMRGLNLPSKKLLELHGEGLLPEWLLM
jgi:hypothetical protein